MCKSRLDLPSRVDLLFLLSLSFSLPSSSSNPFNIRNKIESVKNILHVEDFLPSPRLVGSTNSSGGLFREREGFSIWLLMDQRGWLKIIALIFLCFLPVSQGRGLGGFGFKKGHSNEIYNRTLTRILVEYASAVYTMDLTELFTWTCSRCCDLTEGFEVVEIIVDVQNCLQAYVGVSPDPNAIIVVFRGTQENSIQNWIEDLFWKQLDLNYPGMPDAMVHHGFYSAYHNTTLRPAVLRAVEKTRKLKGDIPIIVVGHSMGGAMASFCALDLVVNQGMEKVKLVTFGQPRIGNAVFASYFIEQVPDTIRVTHAHDIVPHLPPYYYYFPQKTYHHFPREVWHHNVGLGSLVYLVEQICDGSGEDPTCSRSVSGNSVKDHLVYMGVNMKAETWGTCRIVMDYSVLPYQMDLAGNVVLSKDAIPKESESKSIVQIGKQGSSVSSDSVI